MQKLKLQVSQLRFDPQLLELRPVNNVFVSRYRQAMREGSTFPRPIVAEHDGEYTIVSGNHRVTAWLQEFGDDYTVEVEIREYISRKDLLTEFAKENSAHGNALSGFSRTKISLAMITAGANPEDVAQVLNVSVRKITEWAGHTVMVVGKKQKSGRPMPVKAGADIEGKTITEEQYAEHVAKDRGIQAHSLADQLSRWIRNDWIDATDTRTVTSLRELSEDIDAFLRTVIEEAV